MRAAEYWTPRRLTLDIRGVKARSSDVHEDARGRRSRPQAAVDGFLRSAGLPIFRGAYPFRSEEGRFLRSPYRQAGARRRTNRSRAGAGDDPRVSLAEIDALGPGVVRTRQAALGASAAIDSLHLRAGDRRAGGRRFRGRRPPLRQRHLWPSLPRDGPISVRRFDDYAAKWKRPRSSSMPIAASK